MKRRRECFLIDGYNVIHAWPELSRLAAIELAQARDQLVHLLTEYGAFEQYDVTIVFDALFTIDEAHEECHTANVVVVYTAAGETADSRIERLTYEGGAECYFRSGRLSIAGYGTLAAYPKISGEAKERILALCAATRGEK